MDLMKYYKQINSELAKSLQEQKMENAYNIEQIILLNEQMLYERSRRVETENQFAKSIKDFLSRVQMFLPKYEFFERESVQLDSKDDNSTVINNQSESTGSQFNISQRLQRSKPFTSSSPGLKRRDSSGNNTVLSNNTLYTIHEEEQEQESISSLDQTEKSSTWSLPSSVTTRRGNRRSRSAKKKRYPCLLEETLGSPPTQLEAPDALDSVTESLMNLSIPDFESAASSTPKNYSSNSSQVSEMVEIAGSISVNMERREDCSSSVDCTIVSKRDSTLQSSALNQCAQSQCAASAFVSEDNTKASSVVHHLYEGVKEDFELDHQSPKGPEHDSCILLKFSTHHFKHSLLLHPQRHGISTKLLPDSSSTVSTDPCIGAGHCSSKQRPARRCAPKTFFEPSLKTNLRDPQKDIKTEKMKK